MMAKAFLASVLFGAQWMGPATADTVRIGGTGAAVGLMVRLAEGYAATKPGDTLEVIPGLGSGGALAALAAGKIHLVVSGRALNDAERKAGLTERPLARTPLVFVVNADATMDLKQEMVIRIVSGEPVALPNGQIARLFLRPPSDAQALALNATIPGMREAQEKARKASGIPVTMTDQETLEALNVTPNGFSALTLTQLLTEPHSLRLATLDGVRATPAALADGRYPLGLSFALVVGANPTPAVTRAAAYLTSDAAAAIISAHGGLPMR